MDRHAVVASLRKRYLTEYTKINRRAKRVAFWEDIRDSAAACGAHAWESFAEGEHARTLQDYEEALEACDSAIELDPDFAYPWNGKGNVLSDQKRYDEAIAAYDRAIELDPTFAYPWYGKGIVLREQKRYDEAVAAYDRAIELNPDFACPWNGKSIALRELKLCAEALAACDRAIELDPDYAAAWHGKGIALREQKRYEEAIAAYDRAIELDPDYAYPWHGKGIALREQKRYEEATAAYDRAIELDPDYAGPWHGKGIALREQKRYEEAIAAYDRAIELDPETGDSAYNKGILLWETADYEEACACFRLALEMGLDEEWRDLAEIWITRASNMLAPAESTGPALDRTEADKASPQALLAEFLENLKNDLPDIAEANDKFDKRMRDEVVRRRVAGSGGADNMLVILRDWNSFSPILNRESRNQDTAGPKEWRGGGYLLIWQGHGIAIDPGVGFVEQLYRKGFSIVDIDTVVVTHCHLDHTRDVESLVDLNYRYNRYMNQRVGTPDFRQLNFCLSDAALRKYGDYLQRCGCCATPVQLLPKGRPYPITEHIELRAAKAQHADITGRDSDTIGLVFDLKYPKTEENQKPLKLGLTSDSCWFKGIEKDFLGCDILLAHLGTIEGAAKKDRGDMTAAKAFRETELSDHLGAKGCFRLLQDVKPTLFVVGEFGEELVKTRIKILQVLNNLKPDKTERVLGADSNLTISLGDKFSIRCSHPECADIRTEIGIQEVRPTLDGDLLFQYACDKHELVQPEK
jgi:tetratricopeptide (TPR) repeat protein